MTVLIILGEYLDAQINGGQPVVKEIVTKLKELPEDEVGKLLEAVEEDLDTNFIGNNARVVALDEIGAAMKTLPNHIVSQKALQENQIPVDMRGGVSPKYKRGIASVLGGTLYTHATVILAGHDVFMKELDYLMSLGKAECKIVVDFLPLPASAEKEFLLKVFDFEKAGIDVTKAANLLAGSIIMYCKI